MKKKFRSFWQGLFDGTLPFPFGLGIVGAGRSGLGDGTNTQVLNRESKLGGIATAALVGKYSEACSRGNLFAVTTGATGQAPGTVLGVHPPLLIYNPVGSGFRLEIEFVSAGYVSGTLGAGTLFHCGFTFNGNLASQSGVLPVVGSGSAPACNCLDLTGPADGVTLAFANGTLNANPAILYPFSTINSLSGLNTDFEDVDGKIYLEQGSGWCLAGIAAAGTTPLLSYGVIYQRVPAT